MATQGKILVYKREAKKGVTYTYRIEAGRDPITGKRKQVTKSGFKSAKEARAAAQPILNKLLLGENIIQSDITFGEFVEEWFDSYKLNIKLPTQVRYRYTIGTFNKFFRYKKMKDITLYQYQQFIDEYAKDKQYLTVTNMHQIIRKIFSYAVKYNVIRSNPTISVVLPSIPPKRKEVSQLYLTKEELRDFLDYVKNYSEYYKKSYKTAYVYPMCATLAYTGMRVGEACALIWQDIDFDNKTISINSSMYAESYNNYKRQSTPKNESSIRKIIVGDTLISILKKWKKVQLETRIKYGTQNKRDKEDYVFSKYCKPKDYELPVIPNAIAAVFRVIDNHKIFKKHLHAHLFRHTHVSLLAEVGVPLEVIQERLGHSDDETTRKIYLHITDKTKNDAAQIFEQYIQK